MSVIDDYLKTDIPSRRVELERVRNIVKKQVPTAEEAINYGIPTFKYMSKNLIHFAAYKNHMGIFPTSNPIGTLEKKLSMYKTTKGTIQFTENNTLPAKLIVELVQLRVKEIESKTKSTS